jgi:phospholipase/carboxylesterase
MNTLATIELNPPGGQVQASIIWLHGLGADANDFVSVVSQFQWADQRRVRFIFPNAPMRAITVNGGMKMRGWYDIAGFEIAQKEDLIGVRASQAALHQLIDQEIQRGVPAHRIILAGFSQGAAMSLYTGLRYPERLGGIIALSGYLLFSTQLIHERHLANQTLPIFIAHGLLDPVVPMALGQACQQQLAHLGYGVNWHTYPMPHSVLPEEIEDIRIFLETIIPL